MTAEEIFNDLSEQYRDEFDWHLIPLSNQSFVMELKREIGSNHFLYDKKIWAVAKCDFNDDVLFVTNSHNSDIYYIFHLTYSKDNMEGYPRYKEFIGIGQVREYMEAQMSGRACL